MIAADALSLAVQAERNLEKWGAQDLETLGLACAEECGELAQAILQHRHEGGAFDRIRSEAIDLAALCLQILEAWNLENEREEGTDHA